jgi:hypothetical protein
VLRAALREQAKLFFFEKKNQKTFIHCRQHQIAPGCNVSWQHEQKFFAPFFQKRRPSSFCYVKIKNSAAP